MAAVEILFAKNDARLPPDLWDSLLARLPEPLRPAIVRCRKWEDRQARLLGKILLGRGAAERGKTGFLDGLTWDAFGRPGGDVPFDFNISHTAGCVACAFGDGLRVGIDVEKVEAVDLSSFHSFMTAAEWRVIRAASDPYRSFFRHWTAKESVMKADGRGMSLPVWEIELGGKRAVVSGRTWHLQAVDLLPGTVCRIATDRAVPAPVAREISIPAAD